MPSIPGSAALYQAQREFKSAFNQRLEPLVQRIQASLIANAIDSAETPDGAVNVIPPETSGRLILNIGDELQRFFVGPDFRNPFGADGVTALAPYPEILNIYLAQAQWAVVKANSSYIQKRLKNHPAIVAWLNSRRTFREQVVSNPLATYEAAHTWVDPKGYRLSDRIWRTSFETRAKVDLMLRTEIERGTGALDLSRKLEQFLLPDRAGLSTNEPYGTKASYDALRLARTEITRAHSEASRASALANPFVDGMDFKLSPAHPRQDICDSLATIGMGGERLREPYPKDSNFPLPVVSTHPQCLCVIFPTVASSTTEVVDELRAWLNEGREAPITPTNGESFLIAMLGSYLANLILQRERELERLNDGL